MILFKADMAQAIIERRKTVTRRRGKKRWNVGAEHLLYTRPPFAKGGAKPFAKVRIVSVVWEMRPMRFSRSIQEVNPQVAWQGMDEEARLEGFQSWEEFRALYMKINGPSSLDEPAWRVEFELAEVLEAGE